MRDCTSFGMRSIARRLNWVLPAALAVATTAVSLQAGATPIFARQTGQNCQACHVGGQFPELTPYGRMFKLTGYTLGQRTKLPLAVMAVFSGTEQKNVGAAPPNSAFSFNTASLFAGGKITDNIGFLAQYTYNSSSVAAGSSNLIGPFSGQAGSDNTDFRYANRIVNDSTDLIYGVTLNNNPSVEDVWNSSPAWGYGYVPGSNNGFGPGYGSPILNGGLAQQAVGAGAYVYWNKTIYAEISGYRTGDGVFSFLTQPQNPPGSSQTYIAGTNPYLRLALTHDWGNSNAMVGYTYFDDNQYENGSSGLTDEYRDNMVDFQYQYILDPNTVTVEVSDINETVNYGNGAVSDTNSLFRAKASCTYEAKYGGSLAFFSGTNSLNNPGSSGPSMFGNGTSGWTPEIFWIPVQNIRIGYQYTFYNSVGALGLPNAMPNPTPNPNYYDAAATMPITKPGDYNTSFLYVWAAF